MTTEEIYTVEDIVKALELKSNRIVEGWLLNGKMHGFKVGKEWRIPECGCSRVSQGQ